MKRIFSSTVMILTLQVINVAMAQQSGTGTSAPPRTFKAGSHIVRTIDLPTNVKLEYVEQGDANGVPVIFLHGITDSWHSFESVLSYLPKNIHAFAISQRGHGDSEQPSSDYQPKDFANDVAAFIKKKNLGSAIVVGHSMGGMVAQQFAVLHPKLLKGLVIIDSDAYFKENPGMPEFYQEVLKLTGSIDKKFMDDFQAATLAKPIDSAYFKLLVAEGMKCPVRVFQAALKGLIETDLSADIKKITAPTLIFWGDKDGFCLRNGQDKMANAIKGSKLIIYEGTGHALHWEEPQRFVGDLTQFIKSL
ncbi:MAG TPA: alpha/beta hydrolase [Chitinophagaceae bacterium]